MKATNASPRDHPLDEWLSFEQESIQKFKDLYPELWKVFGDSINLARAVPFVIRQQDGLTGIEMHRPFLMAKNSSVPNPISFPFAAVSIRCRSRFTETCCRVISRCC